MVEPESPSPRAGGAIVAASALVGAGIGLYRHQASAGLLIGLAAGTAVAVIIWLVDRRRVR